MGDKTRRVTIDLVNASEVPLHCRATLASGPALTPPPGDLAGYGRTHFDATSDKDDCTGKLFAEDGQGGGIVIDYAATRKSKVSITATGPMLAGLRSGGTKDYAVRATATAYRARPVASSGGQAIDLGDLSCTPQVAPWIYADFVERMFDPGLRNAGPIAAAIPTIKPATDADGGPTVHLADMTGQIDAMAALLVDAWMDRPNLAAEADRTIIAFLREFLRGAGDPSLWLPEIAYADGSPKAIFCLSGYTPCAFLQPGGGWNEGTVRRFCTLLLSGAHMVSISAGKDMTRFGAAYRPEWDLYHSFFQSKLVHRGDLANSHYASVANSSGEYYLDIKDEQLPDEVQAVDKGAKSRPGLLNALLFGITKATGITNKAQDANTFLQLEGWPASGITGGKRHGADYRAHDDTLWNISTFAASPYSEKRATTVFIAPSVWKPAVTQTLCMAPYVGAYARKGPKPQGWMDAGLIEIDPATAAPLPPECYD